MLPNYITRKKLHHFIHSALEEDIGEGDHSSLACIDTNSINNFKVIAKEQGIIAGVNLAIEILHYTNKHIDVEIQKADGDEVMVGQNIMHIKGNTLAILQTERLLLNCMQRMSGIATYTHKIRNLIRKINPNTNILDTRKTTPNFRMMEKWAVKIGGGKNHRMGLFDMIILKDNHIDAVGSIKETIHRTQSYLKNKGYKLSIEIETRNLEEVKEVLRIGGVNCIMLDNMPIDMLKQAVELINGRYKTEASGNINQHNIDLIALCGVDYISIGSLTHSVKSMDISLVRNNN